MRGGALRPYRHYSRRVREQEGATCRSPGRVLLKTVCARPVAINRSITTARLARRVDTARQPSKTFIPVLEYVRTYTYTGIASFLFV